MTFRPVVLCTVLLAASPVWGLSIYDVIQLSRESYGDERIIELIDSTQSAFQLAAEDVTRLKDLGVSEAVIRRMLATVPSAIEAPAPAEAVESAPRAEVAAHTEHTEERAPVPAFDADIAPLAVQPRDEEGAGGHRHALIFIDGAPLLVLRDEGGYATVEARARAVASRLATAARQPTGGFAVARSLAVAGSSVAAEVGFRGAGADWLTVLEVSEADAAAYRRRSGRVSLSAAELGEYWSKLLDDYWSLALRREPPHRLTTLHEGDALKLLYDVAHEPGDSEDPGPGRLGRAAAQMPSSMREHLAALAHSVPDDFEAEGPR